MRADDNADGTVFQPRMDFPPGSHAGIAGQEHHLDTGRSQVFGNIGKVLLGKHFRGSHHTGLVAVSHSDEGAEHRHHGFAGTYIALQQAVHLVPAFHIVPDFPDYPLLRARKLVRQGLEAGVEGLSHGRHSESYLAAAADVLLLEERQLQQEKFFKLKPIGGFGQGILVYRKMDLP